MRIWSPQSKCYWWRQDTLAKFILSPQSKNCGWGSGLIYQIVIGRDKIFYDQPYLVPIYQKWLWGSGLHFQIIFGGDKISLSKFILSPDPKKC